MTTNGFHTKDMTRGLRYPTAILALALLSTALAGAQGIKATVDGEIVNFPDTQPMMIHSHVMVPVRGVFELMSADVEWDEASRSVIAHRGTDTIILPINSLYATVNGTQIRLDAPVTMVDSHTMVPLRFLGEALHSQVVWDAQSQTVALSTDEGSAAMADEQTMPDPHLTRAELAVQPLGQPVYAAKPGTSMSVVDAALGISPGLVRYTQLKLAPSTVIPFRMASTLNSGTSSVGDAFTANLDTDSPSNDQGIPAGTTLEGHVAFVIAKNGAIPGVVGVAFDRIRMANGRAYAVSGTLEDLASKNITTENGKMTAPYTAGDAHIKFVGYGDLNGTLLNIETPGNLLTEAEIVSATSGWAAQIKADPTQSHNAAVSDGTRFGLRLRRELVLRIRQTSQN